MQSESPLWLKTTGEHMSHGRRLSPARTLVAAVALLAGAAAPAVASPAGPYGPTRYHCVSYGGHGYHRCSGGYGSNDDPRWDQSRPPGNGSDCPPPHAHTGYPYGSGCDRRQDPGTNTGG
jgi:hypothetical protein